MAGFADIIPGMQKSLQRIFAPPTAGGTITYSPADKSAPITGVPAIVGKTAFEIADASGIGLAYESRDYLIQASDLTRADGTLYEPQRGDSITEVQGNQTFICRVMLPEANARIWKWSDSSRQVRRIHTKLFNEA